jgi:hypothetical protein
MALPGWTGLCAVCVEAHREETGALTQAQEAGAGKGSEFSAEYQGL